MSVRKTRFQLFTSLAVLGFCLSLNNASWADTIQNSSLNTDLSTQENIISTTENQTSGNDLVAVKTDSKTLQAVDKVPNNSPSPESIPAVNQTLPGEQKNNIVPVLDLKGGVQEQEVKKEGPIEIWLHQNKATGDWYGLRSKLEENGIILSGSYMNNMFIKEHGGGLLGNSKPCYQGIVSTSLELNTEKMHLYPGGRLFVLFQNIHGKSLSSKYVGDYMIFNNYDSNRTGPQLSEYWYEQSLLDNRLKFKIGKQDASADFMNISNAYEFINAGYTFMENSGLPLFPNAAMGLVTTVQPIKNAYLKYGFFDANGVGSQSGFNTVFHKGSSYLHMGEIGVTHAVKSHPGKYIFGMWLNTKDRQELLSSSTIASGVVPGTFPSSGGLYTEFQQMIFKEKPDNVDDQGLNVIGQYSWSPPDRSELTKYFGTGLVYKGLIPKRNNDTFGVGMNFARFSKRLGFTKGENVLEVFYKLKLTPWLYIQPDFQYINKPYYADKSTIVFGVRTNIDF